MDAENTPSTRLRGAWFPVLWLVLCLLPSLAWADVAVRVQGGSDEQRENVAAYLERLTQQELSRGQLQRQAREQARRALQALGYYQPTVEVEVRGSGDDRLLRVRIDAGEPVRVGEMRLEFRGEAAEDIAFAELRERLPLKQGDVFHHGRYESIKRAVYNLALGRGYFQGDFRSSRVEVNPEQQVAAVLLVFDSGPRFRLGQVDFSENPFEQELLRRLVPFEPGEPYQAELIAELNRRLLDSQYFDEVRVRPLTEQLQDWTVPVEVVATARAKHLVNLGVGYSTDVGPRLRLKWRRPWINDSGHKLGAELELAERRQSLSSTYEIPLEDPLRDSLQFQVGLQHEDVADIESDRLTLAVQRQWSRDSGWRQTAFLRYEEEDFQRGLESGRSQLLLPGVSLTRSRVRGGADPHWGDRQLISVEAAEDEVLSDTDLVRVRAGTRWLRSFEERHRLLLRGDVGVVEAAEFSEVPPSLRFFAGGDSSIRGFAYQSIGPVDEAGKVVGGRYLVVGSAEYSYAVRPRWRLAAFLDVGDAFNDASARDYKAGAGFGLHWGSPVGPVRLDFAWGVSEEDPPFRVHVSVGSVL